MQSNWNCRRNSNYWTKSKAEMVDGVTHSTDGKQLDKSATLTFLLCVYANFGAFKAIFTAFFLITALVFCLWNEFIGFFLLVMGVLLLCLFIQFIIGFKNRNIFVLRMHSIESFFMGLILISFLGFTLIYQDFIDVENPSFFPYVHSVQLLLLFYSFLLCSFGASSFDCAWTFSIAERELPVHAINALVGAITKHSCTTSSFQSEPPASRTATDGTTTPSNPSPGNKKKKNSKKTKGKGSKKGGDRKGRHSNKSSTNKKKKDKSSHGAKKRKHAKAKKSNH